MSMTRVRLTKVTDDRFNGKHPNGISAGDVREGYLYQQPEVDKPVIITRGMSGFRTSIVTEIVNESTFKTLNSTYRIEYL